MMGNAKRLMVVDWNLNGVVHIRLKCWLIPRLGCSKAPNKMTMLLYVATQNGMSLIGQRARGWHIFDICLSCGVKHLSYFHPWKKWSNLTWVETNHLVGQSLGGGAPMSPKLIRCSKLTAPATTVSAGFKHSAAVCNEDVYLWGANNQGLRWVFRKKLGSHISSSKDSCVKD